MARDALDALRTWIFATQRCRSSLSSVRRFGEDGDDLVRTAELDQLADLVVHAEIGTTLAQLIE